MTSVVMIGSTVNGKGRVPKQLNNILEDVQICFYLLNINILHEMKTDEIRRR